MKKITQLTKPSHYLQTIHSSRNFSTFLQGRSLLKRTSHGSSHHHHNKSTATSGNTVEGEQLVNPTEGPKASADYTQGISTNEEPDIKDYLDTNELAKKFGNPYKTNFKDDKQQNTSNNNNNNNEEEEQIRLDKNAKIPKSATERFCGEKKIAEDIVFEENKTENREPVV
ncbi:hypothetical protein ABK040_002235 [Willaertia magna]